MYIVAFGSDMLLGSCVVATEDTCKRVGSLEEARGARLLSGDLVFYEDTRQIVKDTKWLWGWELSEECYAVRSIRNNARLQISDEPKKKRRQ